MVMATTFAFFVLLFSLGTLIFKNLKHIVFSLWASGMMLSGVFFHIGFAYIALSQAFVSTVLMVLLYFHVLQTYGEQRTTKKNKYVALAMFILFTLLAAMSGLGDRIQSDVPVVSTPAVLNKLGLVLIEQYFYEVIGV